MNIERWYFPTVPATLRCAARLLKILKERLQPVNQFSAYAWVISSSRSPRVRRRTNSPTVIVAKMCRVLTSKLAVAISPRKTTVLRWTMLPCQTNGNLGSKMPTMALMKVSRTYQSLGARCNFIRRLLQDLRIRLGYLTGLSMILSPTKYDEA